MSSIRVASQLGYNNICSVYDRKGISITDTRNIDSAHGQYGSIRPLNIPNYLIFNYQITIFETRPSVNHLSRVFIYYPPTVRENVYPRFSQAIHSCSIKYGIGNERWSK
jgi:hypothetical protein